METVKACITSIQGLKESKGEGEERYERFGGGRSPGKEEWRRERSGIIGKFLVGEGGEQQSKGRGGVDSDVDTEVSLSSEEED